MLSVFKFLQGHSSTFSNKDFQKSFPQNQEIVYNYLPSKLISTHLNKRILDHHNLFVQLWLIHLKIFKVYLKILRQISLVIKRPETMTVDDKGWRGQTNCQFWLTDINTTRDGSTLELTLFILHILVVMTMRHWRCEHWDVQHGLSIYYYHHLK